MTLAPLARRRLGVAARLVSGASHEWGRERIHALRVNLRRAQPFVALACPAVPAHELRDWLRETRLAEGVFSTVRNCDEAAALARTWRGADRNAVRHFVRSQVKLRKRKLREALAEFPGYDRIAWAAIARSLETKLRSVDAKEFLSRCAAEKKRRLSMAARAAAGLTLESGSAQWHEVRKDLRLFRYRIEDETAVGRPPTAAERPILALQRALGRANDLAVFARRVAKARAKLPEGSTVAAGLQKLERAALARRRRRLSAALPALRRLESLP